MAGSKRRKRESETFAWAWAILCDAHRPEPRTPEEEAAWQAKLDSLGRAPATEQDGAPPCKPDAP